MSRRVARRKKMAPEWEHVAVISADPGGTRHGEEAVGLKPHERLNHCWGWGEGPWRDPLGKEEVLQ